MKKSTEQKTERLNNFYNEWIEKFYEGNAEEEEEMTEEDHFNMKADLDYEQMIDDSLTD